MVSHTDPDISRAGALRTDPSLRLIDSLHRGIAPKARRSSSTGGLMR
jgi:hypothetical protein